MLEFKTGFESKKSLVAFRSRSAVFFLFEIYLVDLETSCKDKATCSRKIDLRVMFT